MSAGKCDYCQQFFIELDMHVCTATRAPPVKSVAPRSGEVEDIANNLTRGQLITLCGPRRFGARFLVSEHAKALIALGLITEPQYPLKRAPRTKLGDAVARLAFNELPGALRDSFSDWHPDREIPEQPKERVH